ncbi:helix-turn-helix transcriptional regulator [Altererythrobacter sp. BO-6]|uniref:helix-turn-helix transcriptional regulator n=1 Tax=Altererythrobacter sp. BO-6 TaxID=2604537 RepID=UPI0013E0F37F|nr:helix-turn-helix transcriptional regulator [Altererythrobacter sp. BO-6]QIG53784.1 helix-turn-helix transcriptional regulator [Altererythrobacter sp. BO-6]
MPIVINGRTLRALRKAMGWSHDDLVRRTGVSRSTVIRIQKTTAYKTNGVQAERLASAFGLSAVDLTGGSNENVIIAHGDFVPFHTVALEVSTSKDGLLIRYAEDGKANQDADLVYVALPELPKTLIIRADDD